jgi:hypothetical protein
MFPVAPDLLGDVDLLDPEVRGDGDRDAAPLSREVAVEVEGVGEGVGRVDRHDERPQPAGGEGQPRRGGDGRLSDPALSRVEENSHR